MIKRVIGIDPGLSGGIAMLTDKGEVDAIKMPPESELAALLAALCIEEDNRIGVVYIEDLPKGMGGTKVNFSGMAKLHRNNGFCLGVLSALKIRTVLVRPQEWQKGIPGLTYNIIVEGEKKVKRKTGMDRKRALKEHACRLFPEFKCTLSNSDALLIADWGKRDG